MAKNSIEFFLVVAPQCIFKDFQVLREVNEKEHTNFSEFSKI